MRQILKFMVTQLLSGVSAAFISLFLIANICAVKAANAEPHTIAGCPQCNVVVIVIDTLRADILPFYGHPDDSAPFLNKLAGQSTLFERAISASSNTVPATASIFTSLYSSGHGATKNIMTSLKDSNAPGPEFFRAPSLPKGLETLPEFMKRQGFHTIGVSDNIQVGQDLGFDRGFDKFKGSNAEGAAVVNSKVVELLDGMKSPYFLYLHLMDPHFPYEKWEPWYSHCLKRAGDPLNLPRRAKIMCAYESEVNRVDKHIEKLAEKYSWLKNSVIIVTADHGEEFFEHGNRLHGHTLYRELIHVPFMIYHPHYGKRIIHENVSTIDIMPTLADMLGAAAAESWQGLSLWNVVNGKQLPAGQISFSELLNSEIAGKLRSAVSGNRHLIQRDPGNSAEIFELYNLDADFEEKNNLADVENINSGGLATGIQKLKEGKVVPDSKQAKIKIDEKTRKQLMTLGYVK